MRSARRILAALAVLALPAAAAAAAAPPRLVIEGSQELGGYPTSSPLAVAVQRFGRPTSRVAAEGGLCTVRWASLGLRLHYAEGLGCRRPGVLQRAVLTGPRWALPSGLRVGSPTARVRALQPDARVGVRDGQGTVWIVLSEAFGGGAPRLLPTVTARTRDGKVVSFTVRVPPRLDRAQ